MFKKKKMPCTGMSEVLFENFHSGFAECQCNASKTGDREQAALQYNTNPICHVNSFDLKHAWTSDDAQLHVLTGLTVEPRQQHIRAEKASESRGSRRWLLSHKECYM